MRKTLLLAGMLTSLTVGAPAHADTNKCHVPMARWQTRDAVRSMAEALGWQVRRIKIDDGCYEITGQDAAGRDMEARIDPASLAVLAVEYEGTQQDNDEDEKEESSMEDITK